MSAEDDDVYGPMPDSMILPKDESTKPRPPAVPPRDPRLRLPPKPAKRPRSATGTAKPVAKANRTLSYSQSSERLTLSQFASKYAQSLPLHVKVHKGFCGRSERASVSEGECFNLHFMKHATVVTIQDERGVQYTVPLNSAIKFGLIYNPDSNLTQAIMQDFQLKKVSDILKMPTLPKVVCATKHYWGKHSLEANEVLVLKGTEEIEGKRFLLVYSTKSKMVKSLPESYSGHFTTLPHRVGTHLSNLTAHIPNLFPAKAVISANQEIGSELPQHLTGVVQLIQSSKETSFVATSSLEESAQNAPLTDIPIDLDVEVEVVFPPTAETEELFEATQLLYETFDPANVLSLKTRVGHIHPATQSFLHATLAHTEGHTGLDVVKPEAAYSKVSTWIPQPVPQPQTSTTSKSKSQVNVTSEPLLESSQQQIKSRSDLTEVKAKVAALKEDMEGFKMMLDKVAEENTCLAKLCQSLEKRLSSVQLQQQQIPTTVTNFKSRTVPSKPGTSPEHNKEFTASLSHMQV